MSKLRNSRHSQIFILLLRPISAHVLSCRYNVLIFSVHSSAGANPGLSSGGDTPSYKLETAQRSFKKLMRKRNQSRFRGSVNSPHPSPKSAPALMYMITCCNSNSSSSILTLRRIFQSPTVSSLHCTYPVHTALQTDQDVYDY